MRLKSPHTEISHPTHPTTYSSEAVKPLYMKDRKSFKNSDNAIKNYLFRKDFRKIQTQRRRQRQRQRQRMKKTQHVLYFRKAEDEGYQI